MNARPLPLPSEESIRLSAERDFVLGDLAIHPSVSEATRGEQRQHVEPRVMQVLVALARAGGSVVSRDQLIQRCWDGRVVGEAAINRCMSRLRALAERGDGTRSFNVETIARVGYRLQTAAGAIPHEAPPAVVDAPVRRKFRSVTLALAGLALAAAAALVISHERSASRTSDSAVAASSRPSIAVLPFKNLGPTADGAYFAAAIQDEILTRLAKIKSLKVISRASADEAAKNAGPLADIARRLGVANVLEGSVQRIGDRVRVNVQVIRAATDDHIWAEAYDRHLDDVLSVENDIAGSIATALAANITPGERLALSAAPTTNPRAYDLYLHALVQYGTLDEAGLAGALEAAQKAVAIEPDFALAWAMIARIRATYYFDDRDDVQGQEARDALDRAMALAPDLAEVQLAHAQYRHYVELDYAGAAEELRTLEARWPNNVEVLQSLAFIARRLGHWNEALVYLRRELTLDPLSRAGFGYVLETLRYAHRPAEAASVVAGMRAIWGDDANQIPCESEVLQSIGDLDGADTLLQRLPADVDAKGATLESRRAQYAYRRRFADGLVWFDALRKSAPLQQWSPLRRAKLDLALGDFRRWNGDVAGAREDYAAAAEAVRESADADHPDYNAFALSAMAYAGLGDRDRALDYLGRLSHAPLAADTMNGALSREYLARTFARLDDHEAAVVALERVVKEPSRMTVDTLRLDPDFDTLRGDVRFQRLLVQDMTPLE
jgi:TolB-like protein/DNA-binding winged helix-turn-helix (wHTH) protein